MAPSKLKVFRTPIGFHDAYVAAPSQKAALAAWGSDHNLFARKEAEIVTNPALTAEPLAHPGEVIKRLRGTADEQMAALGQDPGGTLKRRPLAAALRPRLPHPSRAPLDDAEAALADAERHHAGERQALAKEEEELARRRQALQAAQADEIRRLAQARDTAADAYAQALAAWREQ